MIKNLTTLLAIASLSACSTGVVRPAKAPLPVSESISERIQRNNFDELSGAYVAFLTEMPETKYFRVKGKADCNDTVYIQLVNASMINSNKEYYAAGYAKGGFLAHGCLRVFRHKYRFEDDPRLVDSDGVVFDVDTARVTEVNGWNVGDRGMFMSGWAIKFVDEPTAEEIHERLRTPARSKVDERQIKAAIYWVVKGKRKEFVPDLLSMLPMREVGFLEGWGDNQKDALQAVQKLAFNDSPIDLWWKILSSGTLNPERRVSREMWTHRTVGGVPAMAAEIIRCREGKASLDRIENIVLSAEVLQHKKAAARIMAIYDPDRLTRIVNSKELDRSLLDELWTQTVRNMRGSRRDLCPNENI